MPFDSGAVVPSKRAWVIVTDGAKAGKLTVTSTIGVDVFVPFRSTRQSTWGEAVCAEIVAVDASTHRITCEPARKHICVVPGPLSVFRFATIVPRPSLLNETNLATPAPAGALGSSLRWVIVSWAIGAGFGVGAGVGVGRGGVADAAAEGDAPAEGEGA